MKKVVVFSGAGVSAESGLKTFRDHDGLWENYEVTDVATPEAWQADPELVLRFYNMRREQLLKAEPNAAHLAIAAMERDFDVTVITQNIDDLHERAGSTDVVHLHGELRKARSTANPKLIYDIEGAHIKWGDRCELGSQLRPHVVWFGEAVPMMDVAYDIAATAEVLIVIGTSLNVYPAAGLIHAVPANAQRFLIDPAIPSLSNDKDFVCLQEKAGSGVPKVIERLKKALV